MIKKRPMPDELVAGLWKNITAQTKCAFLSVIVFGLLAHIYVLTNKLVNLDDRISVNDPTLALWNVEIGKWFYQVPAHISGIYSVPFVRGFLGIIYIAIAAALVVSLLEVKKRFNIALVSGLMITIPVVTCIFLYTAYVDAYCFGIMLAALSVWFTKRFRFGFAAGSILVLLSLAIYQPVFGITAGLSAAVLIMDFLRGRPLVVRALEFLSSLIIGLFLYLVSLRILSVFVRLANWRGIKDVYDYTFADRFGAAGKAFSSVFEFFIKDINNIYLDGYTPVFRFLAFAAAAAFVALLVQQTVQKHSARKIPVALLLYAFFIFSCQICYVLALDTEIHWLMYYSIVLVPALMIAVVDNAQPQKKDKPSAVWIKLAASYIITAAGMVYIMYNILVSNSLYLKLELDNKYAYAFSVNLVRDIFKQYPREFKPDTTIVLVGYSRQRFENPVKMKVIGLLIDTIVNRYSVNFFIKTYLGLPNPVIRKELTELKGVQRRAVENMTCYPYHGSIKYVDGQILVLFSRVDYIDYLY